MKITLLGTGNPAPSLKRMGSGYILEIADDVIVLDHGPGSHHRLLEAGRRATEVTHTFFSHLHYDHFVDFPRLLLTRWDSGAGRLAGVLRRHRTKPRARAAGAGLRPSHPHVLLYHRNGRQPRNAAGDERSPGGGACCGGRRSAPAGHDPHL